VSFKKHIIVDIVCSEYIIKYRALALECFASNPTNSFQSRRSFASSRLIYKLKTKVERELKSFCESGIHFKTKHCCKDLKIRKKRSVDLKL